LESIRLWGKYGDGSIERPVSKMSKIGVGRAKFVFPGRVRRKKGNRHSRFTMYSI